MKTLILLRHARAVPAGSGSFPDAERPLDPAGKTETLKTAKALRGLGIIPPAGLSFLCSDAERASATSFLIAEHLPDLVETSFVPDPALYNASAGEILIRLEKLPAGAHGVVLLTAHNPGVSELAYHLLRRGRLPEASLQRPSPAAPVLPLPTCSFAAFALPCAEWSGIDVSEARFLGAFAP